MALAEALAIALPSATEEPLNAVALLSAIDSPGGCPVWCIGKAGFGQFERDRR
jgi:hypothetical protein